MTFFQWRRFNFFDLTKDADHGGLDKALQNRNVTAHTSGRGHIVLGDDEGWVHFLNRNLKVSSIPVFQRGVFLLHQLKQSGLLVAIGLDDASNDPCFKVHDLDKPDKDGNPSLVRSSSLAKTEKATKPVVLSVHDNQVLMAVGFDDGSLILYRGDITREKGTKHKILLQGVSGRSISGLAFRTVASGRDLTHLYVATKEDVSRFTITAKDVESQVQLDNLGCPLGVAIPVEGLQDTHFITGRPDAMYCYNADGRGQCYAFEGEKLAMLWYRNYLTLVSGEVDRSNLSKDDLDKNILTIFDVQNKFIAFTAPVKPIKALVSEWGLLFALTQDNRIIMLTEKDIQDKLQLLFKKNFYDVAVKIAKHHQYDEDGLIDIFRQYGDHLYSKGDYVSAIDNYIKTIGHLEPSYVIRKFLDAHKIHHLTEYLQALHTQGLANEDHTTLLLNCYTKLKDKNKLDEFIFKESKHVDFDVDIAIKVCRQTGYSRHALALAEKHGRHEWYLKMQIEDAKGYKDALNYISQLDPKEAQLTMYRYGSALMKKLPDDTTQLLKRLCTEHNGKVAQEISDAMKDNVISEEDDYQDEGVDDDSANPEKFLHLFVKNSKKMVEFLEYMVSVRPQTIGGAVYTTLLEHYLHEFSNNESNSSEKILNLLRNEDANYDQDQALILCQRHGFRPGALYLYEQKNLYDQILSTHIEAGDLASALQSCRKFGPQEPGLWVRALQCISRDEHASPGHVTEILTMIEKHKLLSPLMVVSSLAKSDKATLGLIRSFLQRIIESEEKQMMEDQAVIDKYIEETKKIRENIDEIKSKAVTIQVTKCCACNDALELPSVHFLCHHSYHQHCFRSFSDSEFECPACAPENKKILDILESQKKAIDKHDEFHHTLEKAENSFAVIAEYFGRGLFRHPHHLSNLAKQVEAASAAAAFHEQENTNSLMQSQLMMDTHLNTGPGAEARLRTSERRSEITPAQPSEGRLRAQSRSPVPQTVSSSQQSEARLRAEENAFKSSEVRSEGRMRYEQGSRSSEGVPLSDARMRLRESRLDQNISKAQPPSEQLRFTEPRMPKKKEEVQLRHPDPFGNSLNPFAESTNPFGDPDKDEAEEKSDKKESSNPFGEPDEYDESLNPFSEE